MPRNRKGIKRNNQNLRAQIDVLNAKVAQLQFELQHRRANNDDNRTGVREKIDVISAEVVDSNPYSRLMALQRMGVVENYAQCVVTPPL